MEIEAQRLVDLVQAILAKGGSGKAEAGKVANHLVDANLAGHDSHGIGIMGKYVDDRLNERVIPNRHAQLVHESGPIMVYDGELGYGRVVAEEAMTAAVKRCQEEGVAVLSLRNSHHVGRVGAYGEQALAAGLISLHFVNVHDHKGLVAPHRGTDARFSTNPVCIAIPPTGKSKAVLLDMATSKIAMGKTRVAYNRGQPLPEQMAIDSNGQPTQDPSVMWVEPFGALLPMGEHKGYGLAVVAELLAGALSGGGTIQPGNVRRNGIKNNMLAIVIDPNRFGTADYFPGEMDAFLD